MKLLAVCNSQDVEESNVFAMAQELYRQVTQCFKTHGPQTTTDLLELLGNIDVKKSRNLPSLKQLTSLVSQIAKETKPDYLALERLVQKELPATCVIQMEKVTATPLEPAGNLHGVITKYMGEIRSELAQYNNDHFKKLSEKLATPEGPKILLDRLQNIGEINGMLGDMVRGKIKDLMLKVYESVRKNGLAGIGIQDGVIHARLDKIFNLKLNHPIKKVEDFVQFCKLFGGELHSLSLLAGNLQRINKKWPDDFKNLLDILDESPNLDAYPLNLLARITRAWVTHFDKNAPFPKDLLSKFLAFQEVSQNLSAALTGIVDEVFDSENASFLKNNEKISLCEIALRHCQSAEDPRTTPGCIKQILTANESDGDWFAARLKLLSHAETVDKQAFDAVDKALDVLKQMNKPQLSANTFHFFTEEANREKDLHPVLTELAQIDDLNKRPMVLAIALKAAQQNLNIYPAGGLNQLIRALSKLELEILNQLDALYRAPKHPDLSSLNALLTDQDKPLSKQVLDTLQAAYDRDYWLINHQMNRNFDSSQLAHYLDNLQDINEERPFLLSQRKELQRWFLYLNAIGQDRGIPTQPETKGGGECKPIQKMSHEEIQGLLKHYRDRLKNKDLHKVDRPKLRLETIALLREAMYRGTGKFPRPTQILYLLTEMQSGDDFIAQMQTGEGKSMTGGLGSAMSYMESQQVEHCSNFLFLASQALEENHGFFKYLGIKAKLIHSNSRMDDWEDDAIHYSSASEMALYLSKMELLGKVFPSPQKRTLRIDEVDFSTQDDSTRYRYASCLDAVTDPYTSPYAWIYESLVQFVDTQKSPKSDDEFMAQAKSLLRNSAQTKEKKAQLSVLEEQPEVYKKQLETWLLAAGKTNQLIEMEQIRFRVLSLEHKKHGSVSKACILTSGRPNIQAEFSDSIQQFLHVRLRQKYRSEIDQGTMPDFLVEPEKTYITSLNSKIFLNRY